MTALAPYSFAQIGGNNGLFNVSAVGLRQGTAFADPSTRFRLRASLLASSETIPMWGGVGVYAQIPGGSGNPNAALGTIVGRALSLTDTSKPLAGFSVTDEAYGMVTTPTNPVPLAGSGMQVNYYPLGSLARIAVQCDPGLVSLRGDPISQSVSWDFTNQLLVPFLGTQTIASGTYNNTSGLVSLTMNATQTFDAGDSITLASLTGTGAFASLDGIWTATVVNGTNVQFVAPVGLGATTITGGNLTVGGAASQALPCKVLDVQATNCEVVAWNGSLATWNFNGAAAVIQI